jgi:limonene-1,2-epoxide hydrolase
MTPDEVVRGDLVAWSNLNADEITSFFADDAVWEDGPTGAVHGCDQIRKKIEGYVRLAAWCHHDILKLAVVGNTVLTEREDHWVFKDGNRYDARITGALDISNGKIIAWRDYYSFGRKHPRLSHGWAIGA